MFDVIDGLRWFMNQGFSGVGRGFALDGAKTEWWDLNIKISTPREVLFRCTTGPCRISRQKLAIYRNLSKQTMLLWDRFGPLWRDAEVLQRLLFCQWYDALCDWQGEHPRTRGSLRSIFFAAFFLSDLDQWIMQAMVREKFSTIVDKNLTLPKGRGKAHEAAVKSLHILTSYALPQGDAVSEHPPFIPKDWTGWTATV